MACVVRNSMNRWGGDMLVDQQAVWFGFPKECTLGS
jgi:hypothetical protein